MNRVRLRDSLTLGVHDRGAGTPIALLHGFTGSRNAWGEELLTRLSKSAHVLAIDLLGHGKSDRTHIAKRYALAEQVDDVCDILDAAGLRDAIWLGYSMGGRIALAAARLRPERVRGLALVGASPGLREEDERSARRASDEALALRLETSGIEPFVSAWLESPLFQPERALGAAHWERQRSLRHANDPQALAASLRGCGTGAQDSYWSALTELRAPTLLVTGALDEKFLAIAKEMSAALPNAERVVLSDAGHAAHLMQPDAFATHILALVERLENT